MMGTIVCNEVVLPIVDIRLDRGFIRFVTRLDVVGKRTFDLRGEGRVFGLDGTEIMALPEMHWANGETGVYTVSHGGSLHMDWPMKIILDGWAD
jgi:hypothetical protein